MKKHKIAILLRVYDRIADLKYNLRIIKDTWSSFDYHIIVVSNGYTDGYILENEATSHIDSLIILDHNWGHKKGSAQLLLEGRKNIPSDCDYTIILEADTWIYSDLIISKYISIMENQVNTVWSSANWYDKDYSLAVDFAIIKSDFIRKYDDLFNINLYPECYIANYLKSKKLDFILITENMPVHIPSYMPRFPYIDDIQNKRFYIFPKSKMVTHHIEFLKRGMSEKKLLFNIISESNYFREEITKNRRYKLSKIKFWIFISQLLPKRSWFKSQEYRTLK